MGKPDSKVDRAQKELKAFKKVYLDQGTKRRYDLTFKVSDLAYYDESLSDWSLETGEYIIYVGNASDRIFGEVKIRVRK